MQLILPEESSWMKCDGCYVIDLEVLEVKDKNCKSINFLIKGCSYKKGCRTTNSSCRKKARYYGSTCLCLECVSLQTRADEMVMMTYAVKQMQRLQMKVI